MKDGRFHFRLSPEMVQDLKGLAELKKVSVSSLIRKAIALYLAKESTKTP